MSENARRLIRKHLPIWKVISPEGHALVGTEVEAATKGEARSLLKEECGGALPKGLSLEKVNG